MGAATLASLPTGTGDGFAGKHICCVYHLFAQEGYSPVHLEPSALSLSPPSSLLGCTGQEGPFRPPSGFCPLLLPPNGQRTWLSGQDGQPQSRPLQKQGISDTMSSLQDPSWRALHLLDVCARPLPGVWPIKDSTGRYDHVTSLMLGMQRSHALPGNTGPRSRAQDQPQSQRSAF